MTHGDITAMEDVFNGQWHPSDSTSRPAVVDFTDESSRYVRAVGNAVVRVCGAIFSLSSIRLSSLDELIVVDEDTGTEWMEVRTPRIGHFFVRCDDIIDAGEVTNQEPNSVSSRLRSLSLSFEEFEPGTVSAFIRLVGRTLTTLSIPCKLALLIAVKVKSSVSRIFKRQRQHPEAYSRALDKASVRRIFSYCEREVVRLVSITEIVLPSTTVAHC
ncbi:hypothetical protein Poli38472_011185 [Pythium oligandrum]|uniref:Uncharacterized protein n=1 Tax=Pythium oligandrum TaxID=41045 RepID=A0A8K1CRT6_PYTOL|nr:hypothetical protein Poli38472_011185 [Pythium oligandrum]|eukprot:TMW67565.1 hypothetical protein Poli38472_011185 [Pythium oligandrum]